LRAYKFRSASNIEFALDILLNRRLYCADWRNLNDPMEGMFAYAHNGDEPRVQRVVKGIGEAKGGYKVCSLSRTFDSHLLWAHYADGFNGIAIEVDLPDNHRNIRTVDYEGVFSFLNIDAVEDEREAAETILFSKYREWAYEQEVRILNSEPYYHLQRPIRTVIVGPRVKEALFRTLYLVCEREGIAFRKVEIGDEGIDADHVYPEDIERMARRQRNGRR